MKKIILAFDGTNFSEGAFEFARRLCLLQPALLTGVFLPQVTMANLWSYAKASVKPQSILMLEENESQLVLEHIDRFEKLCQSNHIEYRVHRDFYDFAMPELKKESHYADVLILGSDVFFNGGDDYLRDALRHVECPVLLVPEQFTFPESIILAYDGSENSIYALKQFAYLFPELTGLPTVLVYAAEYKSDFPDKILIEELVARHYSNLTLLKLDADPRKYFEAWLLEKKSTLVVSGAYGRSGLSQLFKKSFVKSIINDSHLPVFVAHR